MSRSGTNWLLLPRTRESADKYAREWKIRQAYGSYEELLADPEIDVIYNPLPNNLHKEWTIRAMEAGKHVLCEKPIALRVEDVDAIRAAAQRPGRVVALAFMYRHHPQTLEAVELVRNNRMVETILPGGRDSEKEFVKIAVRDNGPGVPEELGDKIFVPFFTTKKTGTGIGLPMAQKIVHSHGGILDMRSSPGEGAEFIIQIPVRQKSGG